MRRLYPVILLLLAELLPLRAQTARLFSPENGLISSQVNQIRQDRSGLVWVCSEGGLIRFDGVGFEVFRHDRSNPHSIPGDSVHDLCEDVRGTKWVGTASGLTVFDSASGNRIKLTTEIAHSLHQDPPIPHNECHGPASFTNVIFLFFVHSSFSQYSNAVITLTASISIIWKFSIYQRINHMT